MKDLTCYINEKLVISKSLKNNKFITINIPKIDEPDEIWDNIRNNELKKKPIWKTWQIPTGEFVVFNDFYRNGSVHLAYIADFLFQVCMGEIDYEDFNPQKDILYSSDDQSDIMHWYIEEYLDLPYPDKDDEYEEWIRKFDSSNFNKRKNCIDNLDALFKFATKLDLIDYGQPTFNISDPFDCFEAYV